MPSLLRHRLLRFLVAWSCLWLASAAIADDGAPSDTGKKGTVSTELSASLETPEDEYRVGVGDLLKIEVYGEPDLSKEVMISAQGRIDAPLLGGVNVSGRTPEELARLLEELWGADYLVDPHVAVRIQTYGSRPVQVLGAVHKPGEYFLQGPTNILDILAQAGGIISDRSAKEIQLKRQGQPDGQPISVNLDRLLSYGEGNQGLQAGDVVYVPEGLFVYFMGEVNKAGPVVYYDGMTVARGLTAAGGYSTTAQLKRVTVLRGRDRFKVNLKRILAGKESDFPLKPGDQIFIPESVF